MKIAVSYSSENKLFLKNTESKYHTIAGENSIVFARAFIATHFTRDVQQTL